MMAEKAMIQDNTRCIGCRACMIACKEWNVLGADDTDFFAGDGYQNPRDLDENNYTLITYREKPAESEWVFGRLLCMHCSSPACVSACPTGALQKLANGAVELTKWRCIGCRYCITPEIHKCTFCSDRLAVDLEPACAKVCPTHAIEFGDRDEMLAKAKQRITDAPRRYVPHIYGEKEVGGTNVFHLSSVPFEKLGYETGLPNEPLPDLTHKSMRFVPRIFFSLLAFFGLMAWIVRRRNERMGIAEDH
jgi:formate dehydrogenase iron-sulfur subunit